MLEFAPIMPAFCSLLLPSYFSKNYAGKIGASLVASLLIIDGFSIDKCCIALSSVSFVAVAVSAISLTDLGNKLRMLPIS